MGMYDNLGNHQVKAFGRARNPLKFKSMDVNDVVLDPYVSSGDLVHYKRGSEVPWRTLFYNFGKDFEIYDFGVITDANEAVLHVIRDGKYSRSYAYEKIPKSFKPIKTLNYYGDLTAIASRDDLLAIVREKLEAHKLYHELSDKYYAEEGITRKAYDEVRGMPENEILDYITRSERADDKAFAESLQLFNNRWYSSQDSEENKSMHSGFLLGVILHTIKNYGAFTEFEKYKAVQLYIKALEENGRDLEDSIQEYVAWVGDLIPECEVRNIIETYSREIPQEVKDEFFKSDIWKWHIQAEIAKETH